MSNQNNAYIINSLSKSEAGSAITSICMRISGAEGVSSATLPIDLLGVSLTSRCENMFSSPGKSRWLSRSLLLLSFSNLTPGSRFDLRISRIDYNTLIKCPWLSLAFVIESASSIFL